MRTNAKYARGLELVDAAVWAVPSARHLIPKKQRFFNGSKLESVQTAKAIRTNAVERASPEVTLRFSAKMGNISLKVGSFSEGLPSFSRHKTQDVSYLHVSVNVNQATKQVCERS